MIAHRGVKIFENKIKFFPQLTYKPYINGIEFDVRLNSHDRVVVAHDYCDRDKLHADYLFDMPKFDKMKMIVDIKCEKNDHERIVQEVLRELYPIMHDHEWELCSYSKRCVKELLKARENLFFKIGYISDSYLQRHTNLGVDFVSLHYKCINKNVVNLYHRHGIKVYAWTVPTDKEAERLKDMGVDEIIRDV